MVFFQANFARKRDKHINTASSRPANLVLLINSRAFSKGTDRTKGVDEKLRSASKEGDVHKVSKHSNRLTMDFTDGRGFMKALNG